MKILFLCVENAGRSQMAEGFANTLAQPGTEIFSAGSQPVQQLNPVAVEAMQEKGVNISQQHPKGLLDLPEGVFDLVVGMGCGDVCPAHRTKKTLAWDIPDPKNQSIETVRQIRGQIETNVQQLLTQERLLAKAP